MDLVHIRETLLKEFGPVFFGDLGSIGCVGRLVGNLECLPESDPCVVNSSKGDVVDGQGSADPLGMFHMVDSHEQSLLKGSRQWNASAASRLSNIIAKRLDFCFTGSPKFFKVINTLDVS